MILLYQSLVCLMGYLGQESEHVVWIRTPDYRKQLYVSPNFEKVWGRDPNILYINPLKWTEFLVDDERAKTIHELCSRNPISTQSSTNTTYYRIIHPTEGIKFIRDLCFLIGNYEGKAIAVAGIATELLENIWENEVNKLDRHFNHEIDKIAAALLPQSGIHLPVSKHDLLPNYYIFLRSGEHVSLTKREMECLQHVLCGKSAKEIARMITIDFRTVEEYISNLKRKLNCKKITEIFSIIHPATLDILDIS